jgi:RNA polymerase sigma factor (sigma-70 family)
MSDPADPRIPPGRLTALAYRTARELLTDHHAAEDVARRTMFAYRMQTSRQQPHDPETWVIEDARNRATGELRRRERKPAAGSMETVPEDNKLATIAHRVAMKRLEDYHAAEDVAACTMSLYYARLPPKNPEAWVTEVARNLANNELTRRGRASSLLQRATAARQQILETAFDDQVLVRVLLHDAVASLPRQQRRAVTYWFLEGLDRKTITDKMGIGLETLKTHLERGLKSLRRSLEGEGGC